MNTKIKNIVNCAVFMVAIITFCLLCIFLPKPEFLDSERREPADFPELTLESISKDGTEYNDSFMKQFDDEYTPDNFPFREAFRGLKSFVGTYVFGQKDKDGVFVENEYAAEIQDKINYDSIEHAAEKFEIIYKKYLKQFEITPYISIIPDKGYFLAEQYGYPSMDYEKFVEEMLASVSYAEYIDILSSLSIEDYYKSDTHWRQEQIVDIAKLLVDGMGGNHDSKYAVNKLNVPFYGVYSGRAPRPLKSETLYYLTNDNMKDLIVNIHDRANGNIEIYDMNKVDSKDLYDIFLGGESFHVTIENPNAKTDKELVILRDSFGRSIIPLLVDDYSKITVIDIRYESCMKLDKMFKEGQDVLFLYSTLVLNNSSEMK